MKKGDTIVIDGERYVVSGCSVLRVELTHLDKDGNPIEGDLMWRPRNKRCEKFIDTTDKIVDFYEKHFILINIIGVFVGFIDLAFFCQAVIIDLILIYWGGLCLAIWLFELIADWFVLLPIRLYNRKMLRKKKEEIEE